MLFKNASYQLILKIFDKMKKNILNNYIALIALCTLNLAIISAQEAIDSTVNSEGMHLQENEDSLANIAFGKVLKKDLLGSVSIINTSELMKKNYSTNMLDGLESYVGGYTGAIWGLSPLIMVDGVPRDNVLSSEIENITVLKGASAVVLYGSHAADGVILITTKRGKTSPLSIDVRANSGLYVPKAYPNYLDAASYMNLYNEACRNDGISERYSSAEIYNTAAGTNPYRYPDMEFFTSDYLRKTYSKTDLTAEVSGGNKFARYYTNFGASFNNNLIKYGEQKNNRDSRYNVRANVDMNITDWLYATANASIIFQDSYRGHGDFWESSASLRPNLFSPEIPVNMLDQNIPALQTIVDNSNYVINNKFLFGGTSTNQTNTFSDMLAGGYTKFKDRVFQFDVSVGANLENILKGLSIETMYAMDFIDGYTTNWSEAYASYEPVWANINGSDVIIDLTKYNNDENSTNEYVGSSYFTQTITSSTKLNYSQVFNDKHNITAALIAWGIKYNYSFDEDQNDGGSDYHAIGGANLGFQSAYNYNHIYYFDFSSAMVHSAKLPEGNRNAFSPAITVGWRLSEESFFSDNVSFIDNLKLTASYAVLNQDKDISEYYLYKGYFNDAGRWYQWRDGSAGGWNVTSVRGDNPDLTFIQRKEFRVGLNGSLIDNIMTFDVNYFLINKNGFLTRGASTIYPSYYTDFLPYVNYNNNKYTGTDFTLNLNLKMGQVHNTVGISGMVYSSEAVQRDEIYNDDYQYREGKPLESSWGYISEGFFIDQADIDGHATQTFGDVQPGDLKYKDVNEDGIVDNRDQVDLGVGGWPATPFSYGLHYTLKWKNFTFFALGRGFTGAISYKNSSYYWVRGTGKYSEVVLGRWTEETKDDATYPRLTTTDNSNNFLNSTFWMYKTNRFDLSRMQLTYDLPNRIFKKVKLYDMSVYISGESLLTISKERELMELNVGSAPQSRFYNIGLKASF